MSRSPENRLRAWWWRQQFEPGALGWLVNPFYFARGELLRGLREFFPELRGDVLDIGGYDFFLTARNQGIPLASSTYLRRAFLRLPRSPLAI